LFYLVTSPGSCQFQEFISTVYQIKPQPAETMVSTADQTAAFFQEEAQMGIPHPTVAQMHAEGITNVQDLADFDEESLQQLADNLRRPGGRVPDPNPNAAPGITIPTPAFDFGAKSQKRLQVATDLIKYYDATGRDYTTANLQ
jgi:hypothetical protein